MTNNNKNRRTNNRSNPVSYNPTLTRSVTNQSRLLTGKDIIVTNFEGTAAFGASDYALNPRLADKFPSANLTAQRYDMYQFEELTFRYHPTTAVTTTPGVVFLAWEPNANRGSPDTLAEINAYECHVESPIYNPSLILRVPKNRLGGPRYTREGPTCSDLNLYDTGRLVVASDDVTGSEGGYVEVNYRIRFMNYHLEETSVPVQNRAAEIVMTGSQTPISGFKTQIQFDSIREDFNGDDNTKLVDGQLSLPRGKYMVSFTILVRDPTHEYFSAYAAVSKNGAATSAEVESSLYHNSGVQDATLNLTSIIESDGGDKFGAIIELTGAAGVMIVNVGSRMTFLALS